MGRFQSSCNVDVRYNLSFGVRKSECGLLSPHLVRELSYGYYGVRQDVGVPVVGTGNWESLVLPRSALLPCVALGEFLSLRQSRDYLSVSGWFDICTAERRAWHCPLTARLAPALAGWCPGKLLPPSAVLVRILSPPPGV